MKSCSDAAVLGPVAVEYLYWFVGLKLGSSEAVPEKLVFRCFCHDMAMAASRGTGPYTRTTVEVGSLADWDDGDATDDASPVAAAAAMAAAAAAAAAAAKDGGRSVAPGSLALDNLLLMLGKGPGKGMGKASEVEPGFLGGGRDGDPMEWGGDGWPAALAAELFQHARHTARARCGCVSNLKPLHTQPCARAFTPVLSDIPPG